MRAVILHIVVCLLFLFSSQTSAGEPNKLIANFIFNLVDFIEWPSNARKEVINICSYGDDDVSDYLLDFDMKEINSHSRLRADKVLIKKYQSIKEIDECDLLYVSENQEKLLKKIINKANKKKIFTVSKINNFSEYGGVLEIKLLRNKVKVKLDGEALQELNIGLSPVILMSASPNIRKGIYSASK